MIKEQRLSLSSIEKRLLSEIIQTAPDIERVIYRLMKVGSGGINLKEYPKINPVIFLLSEFGKRNITSDLNTEIASPDSPPTE